MDRRHFGRLVSALRSDFEWTQFQLSEYSRIDLPVISQIERGVKKHLEPELLVKLANVFQLTTLERKEFLFASTGVASSDVVRQASAAVTTDTVDSNKSLNKMIELVQRLRIPAFLLDVYADVLAINYTAFAFFQVPPEMMAGAVDIPGGLNTIRLVFGKDLVARSHFLNEWDFYALSTMRFFRESSLRYRATPYFQYLIKAFRNPAEYPLFDRYWKAVSSVERDRDANFEQFSYDHDSFGHLHYATATTTCVTTHGELLMNQYIPTDDRTKALFDELTAKSGEGVIRLAPWPAKPMP
jgi:transcriptional regulator with XRE-family HTH domain